MPSYTREELQEWARNHGLISLWQAWKDSGFQKKLTPSVDRIDPNQGYFLSNIRLVAWEANNEKAYIDRKNCLHLTKQVKEVKQYSLDGVLLATYGSIAAAARATGVQRTNINAMCAGKKQYKSVGGFLWNYS